MQFFQPTRGIFLAVLFTALSAPSFLQAQTSDELKELTKIPLWFKTFNLRAGFGYKDNVLLSQSGEKQSAFWTTGLDLLLWRLPTHGWQFNFLLSGDDFRYVRAVGVENEQLLIAQAQLTKSFEPDLKLTIPVQYIYLNQVFDVSATERVKSIGKVLGHSIALRPTLRKELGRYWVEGEGSVLRQYFVRPLDDYWQIGPKLSVGRQLDDKSSLVLDHEIHWLLYDHRRQTDLRGTDLAGTSLQLQTQVIELVYNRRWDKADQLSSATKLAFELSDDQGPGFYDYQLYRLSQQVGYRAKTWQITAQFKVGHYEYAHQRVSSIDPALRYKTGLTYDFRVEKNVTKSFKIFASFVHDRSISNLGFDRYGVSTTATGIDWQF
jgi:hypothetical protein